MDLVIGERLTYLGNNGTLRYIGALDDIQGIWCGIEWDNKHRGKHDGIYNNHRYFKTRYSHNATFVLYDKLMSKINLGVNCIDALLRKYNDSINYLDSSIKIDNMHYVKNVGFEKIYDYQKNFSQLTMVNLSQQSINCSTTDQPLSSLLKSVIDLDISYNLITSFHQLYHLLDGLNKLKILNLSGNYLVAENKSKSYVNLTTLMANSMGYGWKEVNIFLSLFPNLEDLFFCYNGIQHDTLLQAIDNENFKIRNLTLKKLDIQGNENLIDWIKDVSPLVKIFPNLTSLCLNDTNISNISPSKTDGPFKNLKDLYMQGCKVLSWLEIANLNEIAPDLEKLVINKNPLFSDHNPDEKIKFGELSTSYMLVIAKLPNLKSLNKVEIKSCDRQSSELYYLNFYASDWLNSCQDSSCKLSFQEWHPTYEILIKKYGAPNVVNQLSPPLIKNELINVTFDFGGIIIHKQIPINLSVTKCKRMVKILYKLPPSTLPVLRLLPKSDDLNPIQSSPAILLDNDYRELNFYSIRNGDKILIDVD